MATTDRRNHTYTRTRGICPECHRPRLVTKTGTIGMHCAYLHPNRHHSSKRLQTECLGVNQTPAALTQEGQPIRIIKPYQPGDQVWWTCASQPIPATILRWTRNGHWRIRLDDGTGIEITSVSQRHLTPRQENT